MMLPNFGLVKSDHKPVKVLRYEDLQGSEDNIIPANPKAVLYGLTIREHAGVAGNVSIEVIEGPLASGPLFMEPIEIGPNEFADSFNASRGIGIPNGISIKATSGVANVVVYYTDE